MIYEIVKCPNPDCGETYEKKNHNQKTCGCKACKKWWNKHKRECEKNERNEALKTNRDGMTDITRDTIVEWREYRRLSDEGIAIGLNRSVEAVQAEIKRLKETGEYNDILRKIKERRARPLEIQQMSSLRRQYSTGDTKHALKVWNDI